MTTLRHAGYVARIEQDEVAGVFHGEVVNARQLLTFQGRTLAELKKAFADTVADYIAWCRERGIEPEAPYIAERAKRADVQKAFAILKRAGVGRRPVKGDALPRPRKRRT